MGDERRMRSSIRVWPRVSISQNVLYITASVDIIWIWKAHPVGDAALIRFRAVFFFGMIIG
jgi:hypothetical protein